MADSPRTTTVVVHVDPTRAPAKLQGQDPRAQMLKLEQYLADCSAATARQITLRAIPGTGEEIFFPKPAHLRPVYEIEITGVLNYRYYRRSYWTGERREHYLPSKFDAFYLANPQGRFEHPHSCLLVNGKPVSFDGTCLWKSREAVQLEAERGSHTYRLLIDDPGECVGIAFHERREESNIEAVTDDHLTVIVQALPAGSPTVAERRPKPKELVKIPRPGAKRNPDDNRELDLRLDEARAKEFHARLMAIARREQEALSAIDQMNISDENKENYRQELKDFAASEIARLSAGGKEGGFNVKKI